MNRLPPDIKKLNLMVNVINEGGQIVIHAPALDISTAGKNLVEAKKNFEEIVRIFFDDLVERKILSEVLTELGWKILKDNSKSQWVPPVVTSLNIPLNIPISA